MKTLGVSFHNSQLFPDNEDAIIAKPVSEIVKQEEFLLLSIKFMSRNNNV